MHFTNHLRNVIKQLQKTISHKQNIVTCDRLRISVRGGAGGSGIARYNGTGGAGGSVYFVARPEIAFKDIPKALGGTLETRVLVAKAAPGTSSTQTKLIGDKGRDLIVNVPLGVELVNEENNVLLGRCNRVHQKLLVARGGDGASVVNGYKPGKGENFVLSVHLKLRPNVGLVGFPNAGKSTLLKAFIPRKEVKTAPYPFTTLEPQIGFWKPKKQSVADDPFTLTIADLPGLIEGASRNRGKGHHFLKHLEYCGILLLVIDVNGFQLKASFDEPYRTAVETIALLNIELENYDKELVKKPAVVLLNKMDIAKDPQEAEQLKERLLEKRWYDSLPREMRPKMPLRFRSAILASAKKQDINELKTALAQIHHDTNPLDAPKEVRPRQPKLLV
ncbi:unnamed protein product, partial [Mesorhabditis spiculigera]